MIRCGGSAWFLTSGVYRGGGHGVEHMDSDVGWNGWSGRDGVERMEWEGWGGRDGVRGMG